MGLYTIVTSKDYILVVHDFKCYCVLYYLYSKGTICFSRNENVSAC